MEFIKKNYEKVLLALVLLGLTAAVAALPIIISQKKEKLSEILNTKTNTPPKPLPPLNTGTFDTAIQRAQTTVKLDFTTKHNLLNPVLWQTRPDGSLIKVETGKEVGAGALEVTGIKPLYLRVTFEGADATGYIVRTTDESPRRPKTITTIVSAGSTNNLFVLSKIAGTPDQPELELRFKDAPDTFTIATNKPFNKVSGHLVSLTYPPDTTTPPMNDKRVGDTIRFGGADYIIVDITDYSVVIMDKSTSKRTTIPFNRPK